MARKIASNREYSLYTGVCAMALKQINPTNDQYLKITGKELPFALDYIETPEGKFPLRFLLEVKHTNSAGLGVGTYISANLYVSKDREQNKDKTKTLFVNSKGQFAYLSNDGSAESNMDWYDKTDIRAAYTGEKDLSLILQKLCAFTKEDDYTALDEVIKSFYKKFDIGKLNALVKTVPTGMSISNGECGIVGMLSVSVNPETGKKTQRVIVKEGYIMSTDVDAEMNIKASDWAVEQISKRLGKDRAAGYAPKDNVSITFQEFNAHTQETELIDESEIEEKTDMPF